MRSTKNDRGLGGRLALLLAAVIACLALAPPVRAQNAAAAEVLFKKGRELFKKGEYEAACEKFAASQKLDPSAGTLLNLASCHEKQGRTASAWADFLAAARQANAQGRANMAREAKRRAAELEPDLSYLTITVAEPVAGIEIRRDGVLVDMTMIGSKIPVDPGEHRLEAMAAGHEPFSILVIVGAEGDAQTASIPKLKVTAPELSGSVTPPKEQPVTQPPGQVPPPAPVLPPDRDPEDASEETHTAAYVVGALGIAALGAGAVFGGLAIAAHSEAEESCPSLTGCSADTLETRDRAEIFANIANVGVGLGLAGLAVGALLFALGDSSDDDVQSSRVDFSPAIGPGTGYLSVAVTLF